MLNYIKYEIRGNYRFMLAAMLLVVILFATFYSVFIFKGDQLGLGTSLVGGLTFPVLIGIFFTVFYKIVESFRRELYEDRGYLTFSLPLSGGQILSAKLISSLIWFLLFFLVVFLTNLILIYIGFGKEISMIDIKKGFEILNQNLFQGWQILFLASMAYSIIQTLVFVFFSMVVGRVSFKNKTFKGLWFFLFLAISGVFSLLKSLIEEALPYSIKLGESLSRGGHVHHEGPMKQVVSEGLVDINLASLFFGLALTLGLYLLTAWMLEKKVDL